MEAEKITMTQIEEALGRRCSGGTNFDVAVGRACDVLEREKQMKKADVLMITDGEQLLSDNVAQRAQALTANSGVSWFVVGVGPDAVRTVPNTLGGIATSMHLVAHTDENELVAPIVALEGKIA